MEEKPLQVLTTRNFNGVQLDCYEGNDENDFWATREQIGQLLGYKKPNDAIRFIHRRNKERLDKFSMTVQTVNLTKKNYVENSKPERGVQIEPPFKNVQSTTVYNFKGLLEICRWSNQPKANEVIDFLWEIADQLRLGKLAFVSTELLEARQQAKALSAQIEENQGYATLGKVVMALPGAITISEAANLLEQHGIMNKGRNTLYKELRERGLLSSQKRHKNKPTEKGIKKGIVNLQLDPSEYRFKTITALTPEGFNSILEQSKKEQLPIIYAIEHAEKEQVIQS